MLCIILGVEVVQILRGLLYVGGLCPVHPLFHHIYSNTIEHAYGLKIKLLSLVILSILCNKCTDILN